MNFMYLTRAYIISKMKYHNEQYDKLKNADDIEIACEYAVMNGIACEVVTNMQIVNNFRVGLSSQIKK